MSDEVQQTREALRKRLVTGIAEATSDVDRLSYAILLLGGYRGTEDRIVGEYLGWNEARTWAAMAALDESGQGRYESYD